MFENEMRTAEALARKAGATILRYFDEGFEVIEKPLNSHYSEPVTIADTTSSRIIVEGIAAEFPSDAVLSEEEDDDTERRLASSRVWIIDPLDGTKGFTEKKGDFAVQIALAVDGEPVLGVVFQPIGDLLYSAVKDEGCYLQTGGAEAAPLRVSKKTDFQSMTMAVSRSHRSSKMQRIFEHFGFRDEFAHGSVGLKVGFLAQQTADIYIHMSPHTKFWDTAAPQVILSEAGGRLTDIFGDPIDYTRADVRNHNGIFASNGIVHDVAVAHLHTLLTEFGRLKVTAAN
ncbi:MAG: 3'(2'),5'-bisphosphate nucleotidase CysQ [Acidobacteriota bacterium]|nr:3'(2'),5'-bisphosphate nucleotidase CysQ [Acidobacteriota bacterium]MDH3528329.1 3'(2'),5'-bisphosphate nucleotidase CysQ [Acidobacteriota bacterium]